MTNQTRKRVSAARREEVKQAITKMIANDEYVTFASVHKKTGLSRTVMYADAELRELIAATRGVPVGEMTYGRRPEEE
jgi:hypothetical protein